MATHLRPMKHAIISGRVAIEVFDESGEFLATVYPLADGAGIRLITKHGVMVSSDHDPVVGANLKSIRVEIRVGGSNGQA
jgi:hypothetical protein